VPRGGLLRREGAGIFPLVGDSASLLAAGVGITLHIGDTLILKSYGVVYRAIDNPKAGWELAVAHMERRPPTGGRRGAESIEGLKPGRDGL
jgi:hypothetical protein